MKTDVRIRGKVARILNSTEVALNIGQEDGVKVGMKFDILSPISHDISDPDTGQTIGSIDRAKVRVRVTEVERRVSVVSTYRMKGGSGLYAWASLFSGSPQRRETLKNVEASWEELDEKDSYVATGDPVVQVVDDADER